MSAGGRRDAPPGWAEWLLGRLLPLDSREEQLGDLREGFARRRASDAEAARRWYVRQVVRSVPAALRLRWQTRSRNEPGTQMETLLQDLRYGLRSLRKSPGFAIVATVTLALAIGVNTSIFSLVNVLVFADLPMQDSERVAIVRGVNAELEIDQGSVSPGDYLALLERSRSFERLSALTERNWVLTGADQPLRVQGLAVTAELLEAWRLPPVLGRSFAAGEDLEGATPVAMLTHGFWQEQYGGSRDVLGSTVRLDGTQHTVVGVADPRLEFASFRRAAVLTPLVLDRADPDHARRYLFVSGRLAPAATHETATDEIRRIGEALADERPVENRGWGLWSAPVRESLIDENANTILLLLQLTVGMVILIACANIANMLLARATVRAREIAVRSALGARRGRLVRQLLTESLVISLAAATLGLGLAHGLNRALIWISAGREDVFLMAELDGRVLLFTLLVSLVAPMVFGLLPALRASAGGADAALRDGRSADGGRAGKRTRGALVTAQVALAVTLMIVAGLLSRTVAALQARPLGFEPADLLTVDLRLPEGTYPTDDGRVRFFIDARVSLAGVPGLAAPELTNVIPAADFGAQRSIVVEGVDLPEGRAAPVVEVVTVSPGYLGLLGVSLLGGRGFSEADRAGAPPVAIVSREVAGRIWPGEDPVGRRFRTVDSEVWVEVVGVAADVRGVAERSGGAPYVYVPHGQNPLAAMYLVARATRAPADLAGPVRDAVWSVDPDLPVGAIVSMERAQYEATATNYALLALFVTFAVFALLMAAIGIYGVMAYSVSQRRHEIGLRMALGAEQGSVRWMVVSQGATLVGLGIGIGLVTAWLLSRLLANLVYGISTTDPVTFLGVPAVLLVVALVANLIPARRATRLDPARMLRAE